MEPLHCRSRLFLYALPLLLIILMGTAAGAQGFSPFALPGGLFGQGARAQYGPGCGQSGEPEAGLSALVGYASDVGKTRFSISARNNGIGGVLSRLYDYKPISAVYFGAELPIQLGGMGKAIISGSVIIPATRGITENDYLFPGLETSLGGSGWNADTIWGTLQGLYAYPASAGCFLAGFRWDHWQTSLRNRVDISPGFAAAFPDDTGAFSLNGYIPLVGVASGGGGLTVGAVGFPWVPGDFEFSETRNAGVLRFDSGSTSFKRAWFVEIFADYRLPVAMGVGQSFADANLWLFGKINWLSANADLTFRRSPAAVSDDWEFAYYRTMFVVGGKATINFSLPSLWSSL
jgi:hypothetical protein